MLVAKLILLNALKITSKYNNLLIRLSPMHIFFFTKILLTADTLFGNIYYLILSTFSPPGGILHHRWPSRCSLHGVF